MPVHLVTVAGTYFLIRQARKACIKVYEVCVKAYEASQARKAGKAGGHLGSEELEPLTNLEQTATAPVAMPLYSVGDIPHGANGGNGYGPQVTLSIHNSSVNFTQTITGGTGGAGGYGVQVGGAGGTGGGPRITEMQHTMPASDVGISFGVSGNVLESDRNIIDIKAQMTTAPTSTMVEVK
ncbi:hypothetical protein C8R46DRAFT_1312763 [Mycena filopes]|nr:hypothetical protein C8R46DRAFT_1312763 [Mycena filopes]